VWDIPSEKPLWSLPDPVQGWYMAVAFSPNGKYLLTAPEDRNSQAPSSIWEAETGKLAGVLEGHNRGLYELSFAPDGKTLVSGGWEGFVRLWDFEARRKIRDIPSPANHWIRSAVFSSQGKIAFGQDKVYLFEQDGTLIRTLDRYAGPFCFSPDGKLLAGSTWGEGRVTIWNVETGKEIASWKAHEGAANGVAFSGLSNVLATAGGDRKVRLWDVKTQRQLAEMSHDGEACGVAFSPDGVTLATTGYDLLVRLWDVSSIVKPETPVDSAAILWPEDAPPAAKAPFTAEEAKQHQAAWAKYLGVPVEEEIVLGKDADGKDVTLSMILIPPGEFLMGSTEEQKSHHLEEARIGGNPNDPNRIPSEGPRHLVRITRPFRLSRSEVTLGQFRRFAEAALFKTEAERDGQGGYGFLKDGRPMQAPEFIWKAALGFPQTEEHPVVNISWNDAAAFSQWISQKQTGTLFSLPTEAQWEYACRAGTIAEWHSGSEDQLPEFGWFGLNSNGQMQPVGQLHPNGFGLFDMHGNVWEWCADWFGRDYYATSPVNDPAGPDAGSYRVHRGGRWHIEARHCRSAYRNYNSPHSRFYYLGFRVAAALPDEVIQAKFPAIAEKAQR
jgi:formylglycine-generating enzyme required for sulfatase activity